MMWNWVIVDRSKQDEILKILRRIEKNMATISDLDAALSAVETAIQQLGKDMEQAFADLLAKIQAGVDVSKEVADLQAKAAELANFDAEAVAQQTPPPAS